MGQKLGQHFLTSKQAVEDIVSAAGVAPGDTIVEIGPGKGVLTRALLHAGAAVVAVEKDPKLVEQLNAAFEKEIKDGKLKLVERDVRSFGPEEYGLGQYKLVANIPYYITGEILRSFLESGVQPASMTLLVQKEVADRIVARDGKESLLSLSVKAYGAPKKIANVPARYFNPPPKVDSAILLVENISRDFFDTFSEKIFFDTLHAGFKHKRKLLVGNLETKCPKDALRKTLTDCNISETARAENLSLDEWRCLIENIAT